MPRRDLHAAAGLVSGGVVAIARQSDATSVMQLCVAAAGGAAGGYVGGVLPDILEPAAHPNHRGPAHSLVAGAALVPATKQIREWANSCRLKAESCRCRRLASEGDAMSSAAWGLAELFWSVLASFLWGVIAGYTSHLALDAFSPRSLPLICASL